MFYWYINLYLGNQIQTCTAFELATKRYSIYAEALSSSTRSYGYQLEHLQRYSTRRYQKFEEVEQVMAVEFLSRIVVLAWQFKAYQISGENLTPDRWLYLMLNGAGYYVREAIRQLKTFDVATIVDAALDSIIELLGMSVCFIVDECHLLAKNKIVHFEDKLIRLLQAVVITVSSWKVSALWLGTLVDTKGAEVMYSAILKNEQKRPDFYALGNFQYLNTEEVTNSLSRALNKSCEEIQTLFELYLPMLQGRVRFTATFIELLIKAMKDRTVLDRDTIAAVWDTFLAQSNDSFKAEFDRVFRIAKRGSSTVISSVQVDAGNGGAAQKRGWSNTLVLFGTLGSEPIKCISHDRYLSLLFQYNDYIEPLLIGNLESYLSKNSQHDAAALRYFSDIYIQNDRNDSNKGYNLEVLLGVRLIILSRSMYSIGEFKSKQLIPSISSSSSISSSMDRCKFRVRLLVNCSTIEQTLKWVEMIATNSEEPFVSGFKAHECVIKADLKAGADLIWVARHHPSANRKPALTICSTAMTRSKNRITKEKIQDQLEKVLIGNQYQNMLKPQNQELSYNSQVKKLVETTAKAHFSSVSYLPIVAEINHQSNSAELEIAGATTIYRVNAKNAEKFFGVDVVSNTKPSNLLTKKQ